MDNLEHRPPLASSRPLRVGIPMTLLLLLHLPVLAVGCTWLAWEAFCRYDAAVAVIGSYDYWCERHECDGPATCRKAARLRRSQYKDRREFAAIATTLACGLALMG